MNRLDPQVLRARLQQQSSWSKKDFGQHFLIDDAVLGSIIEAAGITPGERILEIGPGMGVLTERLLGAGALVTACELDPDMVRVLRADFPELDLVEGDILREAAGLAERLQRYSIVANIPYQITTPLLKLFLEGGVQPQPDRMVLLIQKEVAERLAAPAGDGDRSYLSVLCQYFSAVDYVCTVPATSFWPEPAVQSAVIRMVRRTPSLGKAAEVRFLKTVKALFLHPRKQLKNVLAGMRGCSVAEAAQLLTAATIPEQARAHELTEEQWLALNDLL